jgi:hypothetical protein
MIPGKEPQKKSLYEIQKRVTEIEGLVRRHHLAIENILKVCDEFQGMIERAREEEDA